MINGTAIILTKNEEQNIARCINSIQGFAQRIVVVDSGSTDNTIAIAKSLGADAYIHEWEYYAKQFNWAIDNTNITTDWIIRIDADEQFPDILCTEIEIIIKKHEHDEMNGIALSAQVYFLGKHLRHIRYTKRKLMIFRHGIGRIENRRRDAHSIISCGYTLCTQNRYIHDDYKGLSAFVQRYEWYSTKEMEDYIDYVNGQGEQIQTDEHIKKIRKKKFGFYYKFPRYVRCWLWFIYNYIVGLGFLDGVEGFLFCFFEFYWYRMLVDAKILEFLKMKMVQDVKAVVSE
jgi:glycosyltransferase involved in cell wall biosynthesis